MKPDLLEMVRNLELTPGEQLEKDGTDGSYSVYRSDRVEQLKQDIAALGASAVPEIQKGLELCRPGTVDLLVTACVLIRHAAIETLPDWFEAALDGRVGPHQLTDAVEALAWRRSVWPGGRQHLPLFVQALERDPERMGYAAILAIEVAGPTAAVVPALLRALGIERTAWDAGRALGLLGPDSREHIPALVQAGPSRGGTPIYEGLGRIGGPEARKVLIQALESPKSDIRIGAAKGLGRCGTLEDADALAGLLSREAEPEVRKAAVEALAMLKGLDPSAHDELNRAHPPGPQAPTLLDRLQSRDLRSSTDAMHEIEQMKEPPAEAIPFLVPLLQKRGSECRAARALQAYGPRAASAVPALISALMASHLDLRCDAARALGAIGRLEAADELLRVLKKDAPFAQSAALYALHDLHFVESQTLALSRGGEEARAAMGKLLEVRQGHARTGIPIPQSLRDALKES